MKTILTLILLLGACTTTVAEPGFIDYSILRPDPDAAGGESWVSPDTKWYDRVIVEPFVVYFHPNVQRQPVDANELDDLLTRLRGLVIDALTEDTLLATEAAPGVLRLEVAITDLYESGKLGLEKANVELRATDSVTGELRAAAIYPAELRDVASGKEGVREAAKRWAASIADGLDAARDG
ncbi:MAG: DUF3313 family protein [Planctomycetota bacterium]|jgi:hypothetical protein